MPSEVFNVLEFTDSIFLNLIFSSMAYSNTKIFTMMKTS